VKEGVALTAAALAAGAAVVVEPGAVVVVVVPGSAVVVGDSVVVVTGASVVVVPPDTMKLPTWLYQKIGADPLGELAPAQLAKKVMGPATASTGMFFGKVQVPSGATRMVAPPKGICGRRRTHRHRLHPLVDDDMGYDATHREAIVTRDDDQVTRCSRVGADREDRGDHGLGRPGRGGDDAGGSDDHRDDSGTEHATSTEGHRREQHRISWEAWPTGVELLHVRMPRAPRRE
jgi:hypothetical protein